MNKPKMILFDYGQTLVNEQKFNGLKGTAAVLSYASANRFGKTAEEVQAYAELLNRELGRFGSAKEKTPLLEIPSHMFTRYLYESQGITLPLTSEEIDRIFWDASSPGQPTKGIEAFLSFLWENKIRTGVISNITYSENVVIERINRCLPEHHFEFILTSSAYLYRKPHPHIFSLALSKAGLSPEEVWFVGDNDYCDILGAKDAGMFPVWYVGAIEENIPSEKKDEVYTIQDWSELKERILSC